MKKLKQLYILPGLVLVLLLSSCSIEYSINTDSTKQLKSDIMAISQSVKSVDVTFIRPSVFIWIKMNEEPSESTAEAMLDVVKKFSTLQNIDSISSSCDWKEHAWYIYLFMIREDGAHYYTYTTRYYKSADATNNSSNNIDAYKTWIKEP